MREKEHEIRTRKTKLAMTFITFGVLMVIWSLVWLVYLLIPAEISGYIYLATGTVISGIAVLVIGLSVGEIGKDANQDEDEAKAAEGEKRNETVPRAKPVETYPTEV